MKGDLDIFVFAVAQWTECYIVALGPRVQFPMVSYNTLRIKDA